jgi:selenocysteine-specific elongation factor
MSLVGNPPQVGSKRLIMCTAGHVDHGKTALIDALTGINCDTHPEERRRGMTINPGFAYLDLPAEERTAGTRVQDTIRLGIVDVPGHHRFIANMLAGACGVDLSLLVVAADDGVMPQTREHLAILRLLGIQHGIVALSKIDLVDPEMQALATADIREAVAGSFLADAEIVPVSAAKGLGLDALRAGIRRLATQTVARSTAGPFRMYIDRIFSVAGFGTVVTGSVMGGSAALDDVLTVLPGEIPVKVRRIERHGEPVSHVDAGERASLNLTRFEPAQFVRGMLVASCPFPMSQRLDVELTVTSPHAEMGRHTQAMFHAGTHACSCRVDLLDGDRARTGDRVLAQIRLARPTVVLEGDRFILRNASADLTLGGGRCVDATPLRHRRRQLHVIDSIRRRAAGGLAEALVAEAEKGATFVQATKIANRLGREVTEVKEAAVRLSHTGALSAFPIGQELFLLSLSAATRMREKTREALAQHHRDCPLGTEGLKRTQIASKLGLSAQDDAKLVGCVLDVMVQEGLVAKSTSESYVLTGIVPHPSSVIVQAKDHLLAHLRGIAANAVALADLERELGAHFTLGPKDLKAILKHLVQVGEVVAVDEAYLCKRTADDFTARFLRHLASHPEGVDLSQLRDLVGCSRKTCLLLLSLCDREGLIRRDGDLRFLTPRGLARISAETT